MKPFNNTFLLRLGLAAIFLSHSLHGIFTGNDVNNFGNLFLNQIGFAPFGVYIAWGVVISQVITSILLLLDKYTKIASIINIIILIAGIVTVHFKEGWFVVGGGRNGMEFSFILIIILLTLVLRSYSEERIK
ncbi:MAG: DoxX family membrane protein [Chitinophagaceae bacterium]|nr:DoxX family membrane protein [Chitinophagaceae bacterium]